VQRSEDLKHLLLCATHELESARTVANAQSRLHEARVLHLEEQLKATRRERDEALETVMQLRGRLSRSPSRNGSCLIDSIPSAVDAAVEARKQQQQQQQQQQLEELQQHLELHDHDFSSPQVQTMQLDQHMEDVAQVNHQLSSPHAQLMRHESHMEQLEEASQVLQDLGLPSPDACSNGLLPQMHSPEDHSTLSRSYQGPTSPVLQRSCSRLQDMQQAPSSPELQHVEQQYQLEQNVHLRQHHQLNHMGLSQQFTEGQLEQMQQQNEECRMQAAAAECRQQQQRQAEQQALLHQQIMRKLPAISVKRHRDPTSVLSVMQHRESPSGLSGRLHRETPLGMSAMQHRDSPTAMSVMQHRDSPSAMSMMQPRRDSPTALGAMQHRESPSAMSFMQHRESPSTMSVMQHPAWQAIPGGNSPYSSPGMSSPPLSSSLGLPSVNLHSGSAVAALLSPLERFETMGVSSPMHLSSRPVHLPEPPEADLQMMLKSLPEKGKLLQAVMQAGPLLQTLLVAGPLPQWRHPPPALDTLDIPRVSMSSSTSCDMSQTSLSNTGLMAGSGLDQHNGMYLPVPIPSQESMLSHLSLPLSTMSTGASQGMVRVSSMGHLGPDMRMLSQPHKYAKIH
jgi:hypothetical protein